MTADVDRCLCGLPTAWHRHPKTNRSIGCDGAKRRAQAARGITPPPRHQAEVSEEPLLTVHEAAAWLHVSSWAIYRLIREHALPVRHLGGRQYRFSRAELSAWTELRHRRAVPSPRASGPARVVRFARAAGAAPE